MMNLDEQVTLAIQNYGPLSPLPQSHESSKVIWLPETPNPLAFALGWVIANAIVSARYADSGIDVIPIHHPEYGWDRFLLTRRVTMPAFADEPADSFGVITLTGDDAPIFSRGAIRLSLGAQLCKDPNQSVSHLLHLFPRCRLPTERTGPRWEQRRRVYPLLYNVVTELILEYPGLEVAREIYVDDQLVCGTYHPLYLHGIALTPCMVYDWFLLQYGQWAAFVRIDGGQTIYLTDSEQWSTVRRQLSEEKTHDAIKRRMKAWLRLEGIPKPETVD